MVGILEVSGLTLVLLDRLGNIVWSHAGIGEIATISHDGKSMAGSSRAAVHLLNTVDSTTMWTHRFPWAKELMISCSQPGVMSVQD